ncbi:MAG: phage tail tape measure protein, partial [Prevotella sp.]|nr:phage tail tape measure protein [Prevotella sp.]
QIVITANAAVAKKVMEELQQRIDGIKQKMAALDVTTKQGQREFKKLEKELVSYNSAVSQNITNTERINNAMKNLSGTSLNELKRALSAAKSELGKMSASDKGLKQMQNNVKALQGQINELTGAVNKNGGAWNTAMKNLTAYVGLFSLFNKAKELVTGAIKKNFEYSGSLTDIRKVSGLTMDQVKQLSTELAKIDTRTSVDGLAQLAYQGAKLGMGKYGVDGMAQFVKAADKINVALGEELGEEALPALSKMVEVMGLIPKMGIEKAMDATGSAMFKLSTTSTATSNDIVEFSKRLTGVARTAGITTDQLLALGSASSSMMLMPEVASTAFGKFITALQKNHNLIAKELGIPDETIKNLYASGHAMDAMVLVFEKMRDKGNMNALGSIFKDLGSDGQRLVTAMVTMAKNVDMLKDHLYESEEAFREATAVTNEYEMQQQSAIGILERANNLWEKAFVNPDGVDAVKGMAEWWYEMSQTMTSSPLLKGTLLIALQAVLWALRAVATLLPVIIGYIASQGLYSGLRLLVQYGAAFGSAVKQMYAYVTAARTATAAQTGLNSAMKLNPWIALASVVIAVAGAVYGYAQQAKEAAKAEMEAAKRANEWKNNLKEAQSETDTTTRKLQSYKVAMEKLNLSQAERSRQISQFNRDFRQYISKLGIEIKSVDDLRKNYKALAEEIQRATYYRLREKAKEDAMPKFQADRLSAENRIKTELNKYQSRGSGFTSKGIMEMFAKGAGADWIYQQIIKGNTPNVDKNGIKFDVKTGRYSYTRKDGATIKSSGDQGLLSALHHFQNATIRERNKEKEINEYFGDFVPEDYTPWTEDTPGTLENNAPDKDAIAQEKRDKRDRERAWREELKQKQDEANAIMDNVNNFYDRQINAKMEQAISLGMDKTEQDLFVEPLKRRKNEANEQLRLAIAGKANTWEQFKPTMKDDLIEQTDETGVNLSEGLLKDIMSNNIDALRKKLNELGNSLNRPLNSILAEVFAKATKNAQDNLKLATQQQEARRKAMQEHDYTGVVKQSAYDTFNTLGYANPTDAEVKDKEAFDKRKANIIAMFEKARTEIAQIYATDVSTEEGRGLLMKTLFGDDPDGMAQRIAQTLGTSAAEWQAFYLKLIQYNDEYIAAEKKQYDDAKKITDFLWKRNERNLAQQERIRQIQEESNLFGKRTNLLSNLGLADLTADPEILLMKARMQAAEDYYAFVERNTKNKQLIDEAERARQEAELAYANQMATAMKSRLSQMKELVQPIEDFGTAVGQALAEMKNDAKSANEAIKSALKSMLESWGKMAVNDVNTQMWKAINDAAAKRGRANAQPDIDAARANAKASYTDFKGIDWRNFGTESHPLWVRWKGDHYEDKSGDTVYVKEDGTPLPNPDGSVPQSNEPPRAWKKRHPDGTIDDYNNELAGLGGQIGSAAVDIATGNSGMGDVAAGIAMSGANALFNANIEVGKKDNKDKKNRKKELRDEKKHQKDLADIKKKGVAAQEKIVDKGQENMTQTTKEGSEEQKQATLIAQNAMLAGTQQALTTAITAKKDTDNEAVESEADSTEKRMNLSLAGAVAKCFDFLGPIAGPIAAAVVTATLNGLLQWAISSAFSSKKKSSSKGPNTRVVSGMLTYDSGNVQDLKPFVANDGSLYWATEDNKPHNGVSLITKPTATTINGRSALVAENGPELVIGRETTRAMMMNNPQLMKALVNFDRNYSGRRAYDAGNITETSPTIAAGATATDEMVSISASTNIALLQAVETLLQRLDQPIEAKIDMYGHGKLYDSMTKANQFMKNK